MRLPEMLRMEAKLNLMQPVYAYGPMKGQKKQVGVTAWDKSKAWDIGSGHRLLSVWNPYVHSRVWLGTVEDRGGTIKGNKVDLFFKTHKQALEWGRQMVPVEVYR